jgi:hypothetical protein
MKASDIRPNDQVFLSYVGDDRGKIVNRAFSFIGTGEQIDPKTLQPNGGRRLNIPQVGRGGGGVAPQFPTNEYVALMKVDQDRARALAEQYHQDVRAYQGQAGAGNIVDGLIGACCDFLKVEMDVGEGGGEGWQLNRNDIVLNVPDRGAEGQPCVWVIQPAPVWG